MSEPDLIERQLIRAYRRAITERSAVAMMLGIYGVSLAIVTKIVLEIDRCVVEAQAALDAYRELRAIALTICEEGLGPGDLDELKIAIKYVRKP